MIDRDNPTFQAVYDLDVVGRQQNRRAVAVNLFQQTNDIPTMLRVEVTGRLIGD